MTLIIKIRLWACRSMNRGRTNAYQEARIMKRKHRFGVKSNLDPECLTYRRPPCHPKREACLPLLGRQVMDPIALGSGLRCWQVTTE
jgi:hypothetical protein